MHIFTPARLALLLLGMAAQAHAQTCFGADGIKLKEAVGKVVAGTWANDDDSAKFGSVENWCTNQVTTMYQLFKGRTTFNADISKWNTSSVTSMDQMFSSASAFNQNITGWDTSSVLHMGSMFRSASAFNQDIGGWDTSSVTFMSLMFYQASNFNQAIGDWDTSKVRYMVNLFRSASAFNQAIGSWDTSKVIHMNGMFQSASAFNQDISGWDTSKVTNMNGMFRSASAFNQDISGWDTSSVIYVQYMFYIASAFNQNLCAWKDKFPYGQATDIFTDSGCTNQATPTSDQSAFCAGSAVQCQDYTHPPTKSPTTSPTANPSKAPSPGPTNQPEPSQSPTNSPTNSPTPALESWDLELTSVDSNFDKDSGSEITLTYKIGAGREFKFTILKKGCDEAIDSAIIIPTNHTSPIEDDPSLENLSVFLDVEKNTIVGSNIWYPATKSVVFCFSLWLPSSSSGEVIKKLEHDIEVELNFENNFQIQDDANLAQISLGSNETSAAVDKYIEACTCNNKEEFICNTNTLGVDDYLNVCIRSLDEEVEIDSLNSLKMVQEDKTFDIVRKKTLVDSSISSKSKVALKNGVHVASVIPASFFSYESSSIAQVSGVVFLKLAESRRRLAVEIDDSTSSATHARALQIADQESAFAMEVQLEKNELGVDADSNGAIYAVMTGFGVTAAVVTATAIVML